MAKLSRKASVPHLSPEEAAKLSIRIDEAARRYAGQFDELESAIGMMTLGRLFGWKVLILMHNKRTIKKYEGILGVNVREEFAEEGPLSYKSVALDFVQEFGKFWKAVSGDIQIKDRRTLQ